MGSARRVGDCSCIEDLTTLHASDIKLQMGYIQPFERQENQKHGPLVVPYSPRDADEQAPDTLKISIQRCRTPSRCPPLLLVYRMPAAQARGLRLRAPLGMCLCGRVHEAEDVVENVVALARALEVESLDKAHRAVLALGLQSC